MDKPSIFAHVHSHPVGGVAAGPRTGRVPLCFGFPVFSVLLVLVVVGLSDLRVRIPGTQGWAAPAHPDPRFPVAAVPVARS